MKLGIRTKLIIAFVLVIIGPIANTFIMMAIAIAKLNHDPEIVKFNSLDVYKRQSRQLSSEKTPICSYSCRDTYKYPVDIITLSRTLNQDSGIFVRNHYL